MAKRRANPNPPPGAAGVLYLVATPIGNLRDITLRALDVLKEVSLIAAEDTRRTSKLLNHYGIQTRTLSVHRHNETQRSSRLVERLLGGESIALVSDAGTPAVSDPGGHLVTAALEAGITVTPVPGANAVVSALTMSGFAADQFSFVGFPPNRSNNRIKWLRGLRGEFRPLVLFEAPHRIRRTLGDITEIFGDIEIAVCREITKVHEELVKGSISSVLTRLLEPKGEFTVVFQAPVAADSGVDLPPSNEELAEEFGHTTEQFGSRRDAVRCLADKYGLKAAEVYRRLESAKEK